MSWLQIKKKCHFWSAIFAYSMQQQWTISRSDCDLRLKVGFIMTTSDDQISGWAEKNSKAVPKPNPHQKEIMVTVWWSAADLIHYRFESQWSHYIWEVCSRNRWDAMETATQLHWSAETAQFFSTTTLNCTSHNQHFKNWMNWATQFCLICQIHLTSHQLTTTTSRILTTFCMENVLHPAGCKKIFPRVRQIPKHGFLCYRNKQTYCWQKCVDEWFLFWLINICLG